MHGQKKHQIYFNCQYLKRNLAPNYAKLHCCVQLNTHIFLLSFSSHNILIISPNGITQFTFVMEKESVVCEVQTNILYIIYINFSLRRVTIRVSVRPVNCTFHQG